ncbi:uncharacterized protein LOC108865166 [Galendromus occidentalis]|uniref:Uncharacterized protein LOC108865166 n=1 Tax=Galendromus occidentalis TaxID=34638 RepID=A0AAJ7PB33_9ACAR|nr:uncharacterized protein LOC108865166 [Galendromus occidentalis]
MRQDAFEDTLEDLQQQPRGAASRVIAVSLKLPPFWPKQPTVYFTTGEAQFSLRKVAEEETKFEYALTALDPRLRYVSQHERLAAIVNLSMGDDTPRRLLDRMLGLYRPEAKAAEGPSFRFHCLQNLPAYVRDLVISCDL